MAGDSFRQILQDTMAAEQSGEPVVETVAEPVVAAATEATATEPVVEQTAEPVNAAPTVAMSLYNSTKREAHKAQTALEAATARIAEMEAQLAQALAAQNPAAAAQANATAETKGDWLDQMLASGVEMPDDLVQNLRNQQKRVDALEKKLGEHDQHFGSQREAAQMQDFHTGLVKLTNACPRFTQDEVLDMLTDGVPPQRIKGWHDQIATKAAPAPAPAATPAAARPAPMPRLDGSAPATNGAGQEDNSKEGYLNWIRQITQSAN